VRDDTRYAFIDGPSALSSNLPAAYAYAHQVGEAIRSPTRLHGTCEHDGERPASALERLA
jgi:hypothetical protein